ncbi:hypothetical protein BCR44DRAFT_1487151 [Catenaria anguillulae PL171]|uniref:Uncharacterized protein n=1 Tax=Catenaria anguillulae PL171 TaxID=765915 RepID=A0A1Y2HCU3_9FUNG|nr:hypothetical protein BCR44DRAFT_1487151 [Catenaria anguillulae PL171]
MADGLATAVTSIQTTDATAARHADTAIKKRARLGPTPWPGAPGVKAAQLPALAVEPVDKAASDDEPVSVGAHPPLICLPIDPRPACEILPHELLIEVIQRCQPTYRSICICRSLKANRRIRISTHPSNRGLPSNGSQPWASNTTLWWTPYPDVPLLASCFIRTGQASQLHRLLFLASKNNILTALPANPTLSTWSPLMLDNRFFVCHCVFQLTRTLSETSLPFDVFLLLTALMEWSGPTIHAITETMPTSRLLFSDQYTPFRVPVIAMARKRILRDCAQAARPVAALDAISAIPAARGGIEYFPLSTKAKFVYGDFRAYFQGFDSKCLDVVASNHRARRKIGSIFASFCAHELDGDMDMPSVLAFIIIQPTIDYARVICGWVRKSSSASVDIELIPRLFEAAAQSGHSRMYFDSRNDIVGVAAVLVRCWSRRLDPDRVYARAMIDALVDTLCSTCQLPAWLESEVKDIISATFDIEVMTAVDRAEQFADLIPRDNLLFEIGNGRLDTHFPLGPLYLICPSVVKSRLETGLANKSLWVRALYAKDELAIAIPVADAIKTFLWAIGCLVHMADSAVLMKGMDKSGWKWREAMILVVTPVLFAAAVLLGGDALCDVTAACARAANSPPVNIEC